MTISRGNCATDASIYQIEPMEWRPKFRPGGRRRSRRCGRRRGDSRRAPGLVGGAIGCGLIVDFARHNRQITDLNLEKRTVRVGAGVVLDQLNAFLKPHGLCFGPDVATSSRATLGGMIGNNSSGSHVPVYGTTADHVQSLELVLADGRVESIGPVQST